ncbi:MAG: arginine--tRNA ligase [bacterium]|nr:arginine--tRNA ligase [bacterium]
MGLDRDDFFGRLKEQLKPLVTEALSAEFGDLGPLVFKFETPPDQSMGHLALACFPFAKAAKSAPPKIAANLAASLSAQAALEPLAYITAAGPYLNFMLKPAYLAAQLMPQVTQPDFGDASLGRGQRVLLEYSSPNTNKPLHLGHGRNNLLGMALANLLERVGYEVTKANLVNDRGIHICKSMLAYQRWGNGITPESNQQKGDKLVGDFYVLYDQKSKEIEGLDEAASEMLRQWEAGEPEVRKLWAQMNQWVMAGFKETYQRLGCQFDQFYFESETFESGRQIVLDAKEKGLCQVEDNGALSIDLDDLGWGKKILLRGDGTSMYITQDLGTTVQKYQDHQFDRSFFVVGNEQDLHFKMLFEVLKRFGYDWAERLEHISYGMITLPEGKMKSREGTVVDLDDLLDGMKELAIEEIKARDNLAVEQIEATAEAIGQAAVKYYILRAGAAKEIQFNPKESLAFEGATGPYLQYTHARIHSLLSKAVLEAEAQPVLDGAGPWGDGEREMLVLLARYYEAQVQAATDRNPAVLCSYLFDLAKGFNKYYYETPILRGEAKMLPGRLGLCAAVRAVLAKGLTTLGIEPLDKM